MAWGGFLASRDRIGLTCFVTRHNPVSTATIKPIYPILLVINDVSISCYICVGSVVAKCWFPYKIDTISAHSVRGLKDPRLLYRTLNTISENATNHLFLIRE